MVYDKAFSDGAKKLTSHAFQLDLIGDGSLVRIKSENFVAGAPQDTYDFIEQREIANTETADAELPSGRAPPEPAVEVMVYDKAFSDGAKKLTSHAFQLDLIGDGSLVRIKSENFVAGAPQDTYDFIEQREIANTETADAELRSGSASQETAVEVMVYDKAFSDGAKKLPSHAFQLDFIGDGSLVRIKSENFVAGAPQDTYDFIEQREIANAETADAELRSGSASQETAVEVMVYDK